MLSTQIRIIFDVLSIVGGVLLHSCPLGPFLRALVTLVKMSPALGAYPG